MIKHEVDNDACHRNVKPDRVDQASQTSMRVEIPAQCASKRDKNEWSQYSSQYRMGREHSEVDGPCEPGSLEPGRPQAEIIGSKRVVRDVRN